MSPLSVSRRLWHFDRRCSLHLWLYRRKLRRDRKAHPQPTRYWGPSGKPTAQPPSRGQNEA